MRNFKIEWTCWQCFGTSCIFVAEFCLLVLVSMRKILDITQTEYYYRLVSTFIYNSLSLKKTKIIVNLKFTIERAMLLEIHWRSGKMILHNCLEKNYKLLLTPNISLNKGVTKAHSKFMNIPPSQKKTKKHKYLKRPSVKTLGFLTKILDSPTKSCYLLNFLIRSWKLLLLPKNLEFLDKNLAKILIKKSGSWKFRLFQNSVRCLKLMNLRQNKTCFQ